MQEPRYHLEAVVKSRGELEDFSGPLDLILMLLSKNKIEIRDIQISLLLDQYLAYLDQMKAMDLEIASEFVQMASHLTYIKTRMLLAGEEEVTELDVLVNALEELQNRDALAAVKEVVPVLDERAREGMKLHVKAPSALADQSWDYRCTQPELLRALAAVLLRSGAPKVEEPALLQSIPRPIVYGIREKSREVMELLKKKSSMKLAELYALCKSRSELVATFISVLELCSEGKLHVEKSGGDFTVAALQES